MKLRKYIDELNYGPRSKVVGEKVGIEIELEIPTTSTRKVIVDQFREFGFKATTDGSLRNGGIEIVSKPIDVAGRFGNESLANTAKIPSRPLTFTTLV